MKLTFLGTGTSQGVPVITCTCPVCHSGDPHDRRLRTSALVTTDGGANILIDIGPDFRQQMFAYEVTHLDAILITHAHRDHVAGIDDIRPFNYTQGRAMEMYMNAKAAYALRRDYHYIFESHQYPGLPEANLHVVDEPFEAAGERVVPIHALHKDLPVLGFRIGPLAYVTDANHIDDSELEKVKGVRVLVVNALRQEKHFSHFCLPEALEVVKKVHPEQAFLTHMSHEMGFHAQVQSTLPDGVSLAYDGLEIEV